MERDYGYVKVKMGPLFPSNRNTPTSGHNPISEIKLAHSRDSRFLPEKARGRNINPSPKYGDQRHSWNHSDNVSNGRYADERHQVKHKRPISYHPTPNDGHLYPVSAVDKQRRGERVVPVSSSHDQERRDPEHKQVQRSSSFYRSTSPPQGLRITRHSHGEVVPLPRSSSKLREATRPVVSQPDYGGLRSHSANPPQYRHEKKINEDHNHEKKKREDRYSQETRNSNLRPDPDHLLSSRGRTDQRDHIDKIQRPYIPKPDYTWHKKKKKQPSAPSHDWFKY